MSVYFIRRAGSNLVKVGWSSDPVRRLSSLRTAVPEPLHLLATRPGGPEEERRIHHLCSEHRVGGEWFRMCERLAVEIAACSPQFVALAELEPALWDVAGAAGEVEYGARFCAASEWHGYEGYGLKQRVERLVGWLRKRGPEQLTTTGAYDVVYDVISKILPDCRECNCIGALFG